MEQRQFPRFASSLASRGAAGVYSPEFSLGKDGPDEIFYIPFEHFNASARLVLVGITPGPTQLELAYETAQRCLRAGMSHEAVQRECKKAGAFAGPTMRPNLLRMLRHFGFEKILGVDAVEELWGSRARLLHSTSVVPHAAFRKSGSKSKPFAGSFDDIIRSDLMRECFRDCFATPMREMSRDALYVALGPTPRDALGWLARNGIIREDQILGSFCHPSSNSGSATSYYLREVSREDLNVDDPVRRRCDGLDRAYAEMLARTRALGGVLEPSARGIDKQAALPAPSLSRAPSAEPAPPAPSAPSVLRAVNLSASPKAPAAARAVADAATGAKVRPAIDSANEEDIAVIMDVFARVGYRPEHSTRKVARFKAPNAEVVYLVKSTSRLNSVTVAVHPRLDAERLANLPGVAHVPRQHRFHSNMTAFPKRINEGQTPTSHSWHVVADSVGGLERFLSEFAKPESIDAN